MSVPPRTAAEPAAGDPRGEGRPRPPLSPGRLPRWPRRIRGVTDSHSGPPAGPPLDGGTLPAGSRVPRATSTHYRRRGRHDYLEPEDSKIPSLIPSRTANILRHHFFNIARSSRQGS